MTSNAIIPSSSPSSSAVHGSSAAAALSDADLSSDRGVAQALAQILCSVPDRLSSDSRPLPLLRALSRADRSDGLNRARDVAILAAMVHSEADERRTAEYLLRHRADVKSGRRSASDLIRAARCAAEMDVRRIQSRELPVAIETLPVAAADQVETLDDAPSVGDVVLAVLERVIAPARLDAVTTSQIRDAVVIALELAERHSLNGGTGPSILAMRPAARRHARLVTRLRCVFSDDLRARAISRLLTGSDGTAMETALLWWAARGVSDVGDIPALTCVRWRRDLGLAIGAKLPSTAA